MRAPAAVRLERFQRLIEQVAFESSSGSLIIVEGQKDRESLRKLGITGPIQCIQSSRQNAMGFVEKLARTKRIVVLTDFDREGISLAKKLERIFTAHNVIVNLVLWKNLRELTRSHVRSIEELPKYFERLNNEIYNRTRRTRTFGSSTDFDL
jgi:5S rRNA maturation endonuclease (ribonuclease M5)